MVLGWSEVKAAGTRRLTPGQSGSPGSTHYRDLFPKWAKGQYVPLSYSRKAVEAATERVLKLTPAS